MTGRSCGNRRRAEGKDLAGCPAREGWIRGRSLLRNSCHRPTSGSPFLLPFRVVTVTDDGHLDFETLTASGTEGSGLTGSLGL